VEDIRRRPLKEGNEVTHYKIIQSPVGLLTIVANEHALLRLSWGDDADFCSERNHIRKANDPHTVIEITEHQLAEYFAGVRTTFEIPLAPMGTAFQKLAWQELLKIPYGSRITYGEQARNIGRPKASRAVGAANGKNPIGIIIPCHRVIGASGHLTGFAGGLEIKQRLLEYES
jgi:methylated-DNA-[protein]-cysteine S-methyltransferase